MYEGSLRTRTKQKLCQKTTKFSTFTGLTQKNKIRGGQEKSGLVNAGPGNHHDEAKFGTSTTWQRRASPPAREMHVATSLGKQTRLRHMAWYAKLHRTAAPQSSIY